MYVSVRVCMDTHICVRVCMCMYVCLHVCVWVCLCGEGIGYKSKKKIYVSYLPNSSAVSRIWHVNFLNRAINSLNLFLLGLLLFQGKRVQFARLFYPYLGKEEVNSCFFLRALARTETQSASSRFWAWLVKPIFYEDNSDAMIIPHWYI